MIDLSNSPPLPDARVAGTSKSETAYQNLKWRLIMGDLSPAAKISIRRQAQETGIGEMPVREALKRLVSTGALQVAASRSFQVPPVDPTRISNLLFIRSTLEGAATELAVPRIGAPVLERLAELAEEMDEMVALGDVRRYLAANYSFHFSIYTNAGNPDLAGLIEELWVRTGPFVAAMARASDADGEWRHAHMRIVDAIRTRDIRLARRRIEEDISWGVTLYRAIGQDG